MRDTLLSLIPPVVVLVLVLLAASCTPAQATPAIGIPVYERATSTPDIVKVVAVALIAGLMLKDRKGTMGMERTDRLVRLLPSHRATFLVIDIPIR